MELTHKPGNESQNFWSGPMPLLKTNVYMISELSSCALCIVHVIEHLNNL